MRGKDSLAGFGMQERLRLGIDVGTSSIGWALLALDGNGRPARLVDAGVRIFSSSRHPKSNDPLSIARREARQARRQRDRRLQRKRRVMNELVRLGLMPADHAERKALETVDPYTIRAKGLSEPLPPHELGRALFHLAQRRGFRSGRLGAASDDGIVRESIADLRAEMEKCQAATLGDLWHRRLKDGKRVRGAFWTAREMAAAEFDALVTRQVELQPELGPVGRFDHLRGCIFCRSFYLS
jgi:CRISPR-associated endonuclease Csn1